MLVVPLLALSVTFQAGSPPPQRSVVRDSTPADSARKNAPRRLPVTAEVLASAFQDDRARDLFNRARKARIAQDSTINSYDAKVRQRMSASVGIGRFGRDHLVYRTESAARVQWQRDAGVRVEVTGARVGIPVITSTKAERDALQGSVTDAEMAPIPYFPGSETLLIANIAADAEVNERSLVNPLADGAEAYYTYAIGSDSISFRLPDGRSVQLRELKVRPRVPKPNVAVGSLWFEAETGQLVRAAYRLAVPGSMTVSVDPSDGGSAAGKRIGAAVMQAIVSPMTAEISGIVLEYALLEGRYWLPRSQSVEGVVQAMFARVPLKIESAFTYATVNTPLGLPKIVVDTSARDQLPELRRPPPGLDSAARRRWRDSTRAVFDSAMKARRDSVKRGMRVGSMRQCDTASTRVKYRTESNIAVETRVPCDLDLLINSPDLPASLYAPREEMFGSTDAEKTLLKTLSMAAQPPFSLFALSPPRMQLGPSMTRYNRVEGFSTGLLLEQQLGGGFVATGIGRFGVADRMPSAELSIGRTNLSKTITLSAYRRLVSANDWGSPLSFGSGLSAFLFGRDEGFYYRATGSELLWSSDRGARLDWRLFAEQQTGATQRTSYSVAGNFRPNIEATSGVSTGAAVRYVRELGVATRGFRAFTDLRLEGAHGDSSYGRAALDVTLSRALIGRLDGALTLAGGTSVGHLPPQRRWFLGGTETIRGQSADTAQSGNAFWMGRAELARTSTGFRTSLFGDFGWVGDRTKISDIKRPMSGVGVGLSFLDGLIRFDVARGLYPREQTRVSLYLGARF
ncbi:MAG TPA: BamA/TamA family outer membrane protein [Gemmatimonadaceae bacterium]